MTSFRANKAGFDAMAVGPGAYAAVRAKAEEARAVAEGLAQEFRISGDYADSFGISEEPTTLNGETRASALLKNTSDHAAAVEWGNKHAHRAHRVLGKALDAVRGD